MNLKVGIVGFGGAGMAQYQHFLSLACEVRAIYDPKPTGISRAKNIAPGSFITNDLEEFLASGIEAVAVCSPDRTHADYVVAAIEAGLHVVCEKPLADSLEGCCRILNAEANSNGVVAAVQHQMRFLPVHLGMKRLVKSGRLGRISYIEGYYVHNLTERASRYDDWRFTDNATPLVYSGCHFVDLLRWLLEDEVEEVTGMANNISFPEYPESDLNVILLRFKSGAIGKVVVAFGAGRPQDHSVRIYGTEASIENNMLFSKTGEYHIFERPHLPQQDPALGAGKLFSFRGNGYRERIQRYRTYLGARLLEGVMKYKGLDGEYSICSYPMRLYPHDMAVRASLKNFVGAIRKENQLECSLKDAARTVTACLAGVEAYRSGGTIKVADFRLPELDEHRKSISYAV
jgi:predicted dehydrogenase